VSTIRIAAAVLLALAPLAACRSRSQGAVSEGVLCRGFELQVFRPTGVSDTLAAQGASDDVFGRVNEFQRNVVNSRLGWPTIPVWVRWRGHRLGPGAYGHLGQYRYAFEVTEILEMRQLPDSACAWARPV
jgi:hypothetical protein